MKIWIILIAITKTVSAFPTLERIYPGLTQLANINLYLFGPSVYVKSSNESENTNTDDTDFPAFITTLKWEGGEALIAFLVGMYCFTFLALICDKYFLPCIERICEALNLSQDLAAATFMAMATSAPEFFVNVVGTFITESDLGVGTVIGSSLFNSLGIAALGSLSASKPIQVDWWPVTRDCTLYMVSICVLTYIAWDGRVYWFEGMILFILYFLYFIVMFNNNRISKAVRRLVKKYSKAKDQSTIDGITAEIDVKSSPVVHTLEEPIQYYKETKAEEEGSVQTSDRRCSYYFLQLWSLIILPLKLLLMCTIPNPVTWPRLFPLTFIICIIFIGLNSYVVSWMISIIGHTLHVPDVVLGLTFLAAGGGLPEAISIVIMSRRGNGKMGVSNALGANSMNILLSLGLPWFVKTLILNANNAKNKYIELESESIGYMILGLVVVVLALFTILYFNKFTLSKLTGVILVVAYLAAVCLALASELVFVVGETS